MYSICQVTWNTLLVFVSEYHRSEGPLTVSDLRVTPLAGLFVQAGVSLGYKQTDINGEDQLGELSIS